MEEEAVHLIVHLGRVYCFLFISIRALYFEKSYTIIAMSSNWVDILWCDFLIGKQ